VSRRPIRTAFATATAAALLAAGAASAAPVPTFKAPGVPFPGQLITLSGANWMTSTNCTKVLIRRLNTRPILARGAVNANGRWSTRWRVPATASGQIKLSATQTCGRAAITKRLTIFISGN
jgi:hypothetical protein